MPVCGEARKNTYVVNFRCGQHGVFEAIRKAEPKLLSVFWEMIALRGMDNTFSWSNPIYGSGFFRGKVWIKV